MKVKHNKREDVSLAKLNEIFGIVMFQKLLEHQKMGWQGWNNKKEMEKYRGGLKERIIKNALQEDWVDVANLAMFAWNFQD